MGTLNGIVLAHANRKHRRQGTDSENILTPIYYAPSVMSASGGLSAAFDGPSEGISGEEGVKSTRGNGYLTLTIKIVTYIQPGTECLAAGIWIRMVVEQYRFTWKPFPTGKPFPGVGHKGLRISNNHHSKSQVFSAPQVSDRLNPRKGAFEMGLAGTRNATPEEFARDCLSVA